MSPAAVAKAGLLLAPGAGADRDQATLVSIDKELKKNKIITERMDFPYRKAGRRAPDRGPVLIESVNAELTKLAKKKALLGKPIFAGGRSMGGRMTSIATAQGADVSGLVLISYPLHPPGKPNDLRVDHFPNIKVPCLFISGTHDAFGTEKEFAKATKTIKGDVTHLWMQGGDHGLKKFDTEVVSLVLSWLLEHI